MTNECLDVNGCCRSQSHDCLVVMQCSTETQKILLLFPIKERVSKEKKDNKGRPKKETTMVLQLYKREKKM